MKILLVEDDKLLRDMFSDGLKAGGHKVFEADAAQEALNALHSEEVELMVLDMVLPGRSGIEVLHEMCSYQDWRKIPVVLLSDYPERRFQISLEDMKKYCVQRFLYKPDTTPKVLLGAVREVAGAALQN